MRSTLSVVTIIGILSFQVSLADDQGHCVWYGQCGIGPTGKAVNCYYNGTAKRVLDDAENGEKMLATLKTFCPNLYDGHDTATCCSYDQFQALVSNMQYPAPMYSRCPSCWQDYRDLFCASTCDPHMSKFIQVQRTNESSQPPFCSHPPCQILKIGYYLTPEYANTLYNACDHVQFPSSNHRVIGSFCGGHTADQCNSSLFLGYQGTILNGFAPFEINFTIINKYPGYEPYDRRLYRCDEPLNSSACGFACSCTDCPAACITPPTIPKSSTSFTIGSLDGALMIMIIAYSAFLVLFVLCVTIRACCSHTDTTIDDENSPLIRNTEKSETQHTPYSGVRRDLDGVTSQQGLRVDERDISMSTSASINGEYGDDHNVQRRVNHHDPHCVTRMGTAVEYALKCFFGWLGTFCATHHKYVIFACVLIVAVLGCGITKLTVTTNPVDLWSAPNSRSRIEKNYFDSHFGPFYRTEQVIIRAPTVKPYNYTDKTGLQSITTLFGGVFNKSVLTEVYWLQRNITHLVADDNTTTLDDICWQPLHPDNDHCAVESVWQYFQNNLTLLDMTVGNDFEMLADYHTHLGYCFNDPTSVNDTIMHHPCLADYGGPVPVSVALGGYNDSTLSPPYPEADTLFLTIIVNNHVEESRNKKAELWEKKFIKYLKNYKSDLITISFTSERSVTDEINRESASDISTVAISYALMFAYVTIFLGHIQSLRRVMIDSKMCLGLAGVLIVLSAVLSSIGLFSYFGQPVTLIVVEVIPFLVLAVGVDNIFILVQAFQRRSKPDHTDLAEQVGIVMSEVGPSMLLTGLSESVAFFLGALATMPAVRSFSLYAGMAILIDFLLQVTCFVAFLYLDAKRQIDSRLDVVCCVRDKRAPPHEEGSRGGVLYSLIRDYYSNVVAANHLHIGLDQKLSMPKDSYLQNFFKDQAEYGRVGPPVYFVVKDKMNYSSVAEQNKLCSLPGCNNDSLTAQLMQQAAIKHYSKIANAPNSWLDDYLVWASPNLNCCRVYEKLGNFCSSSVDPHSPDCKKCLDSSDLASCFSPKQKKFYHLLHYFLKDNPGINCSKGGHAAYSKAVKFEKTDSIGSSYFSTYHTALAIDTDFIDALKRARAIADNLTLALNGSSEVFPYCLVYVYYEQYLTIVHEAALNLGLCAAAIFIITFLLMGFNFPCAIIVTLTVAMIVVDLMGIMYLWGITLNAVSVVNLVMAVGISVEFCSHITRSFAIERGDSRVARARHALIDMGSSVLSGITLTKFVGIVVLAFSKSQLFEMFYFRMYLSIVLLGAGHGLVFLPVLLSYVGPASMSHFETSKRPLISSLPPTIDKKNRSAVHCHRQSPAPSTSSPTTQVTFVSQQVTPPVETSRLVGSADN
ncbi:NPC intracellular cholesterol transporter 1-like isoform X2 [Corticium candelabrum]|uniref:NPC intracellular cholesterol transporter 1-like isoform X2 n=1 Tax=Corticium candelabrum TaxID=121492 RepID=UPI002E25BB7E|nr:NPC intracellular cholesterol transporter 1-like isoform X2 [Corticium candelabrum]